MQTTAMKVPVRANPFEFVLRRIDHFMVAAVVEVLDGPVAHQPLERLDVGDVLADAEGHEEVMPDDGELHEAGVAVVLV